MLEGDRGQLAQRYGAGVFASVSDFRVGADVEASQGRECVFLDDEITAHTARGFINKLREINTKDPNKEVIIRINSSGGSLQGAMDIANHLHYIENPVTTIAESRAKSGAALLLASGDRGRRLAFEDSRIMIHHVQLTISSWKGSIPEFMEFAKREFRDNKAFLQALAEAIGIPFRQLWHDAARDLDLTPEQALEYGIIDRIIPRHKKGLALSTPTHQEEAFLAASGDESEAVVEAQGNQTIYRA